MMSFSPGGFLRGYFFLIIRNDASRTKWPRLGSTRSPTVARPPDTAFMMGGEENAAQPHFPPLPN